MLKKVFCYFFISVFVFNVTAKLFPFLDYAINKEFIVKNLCENRNKPKMNCNGKCHLKKQLQKAEKNDAQGKTEVKDKAEDLFFSQINTSLFKLNGMAPIYTSSQENYSFLNSLSVFHPPCA